ncbi:hypothetical protein WDZ92_53190, partial [Nostoc sp. NIES-2111]
FLVPVEGPRGQRLSVDGLSSLLGDKRKRKSWRGYPLRSGEDGLPYCPVEVESISSDFKVSSSERDLAAGFARLAASRMRLIDGVVWQAVPEPCLAIYAEGPSVIGDVRISAMHRTRHLMDATCFRLDEVDAATEYALEIADKFGRRPPTIAVAIEHVRPDLLSFDSNRAMAEIIAYRLRPEQRQYELSTFMLEEDPAKRRVEELFGAIDN